MGLLKESRAESRAGCGAKNFMRFAVLPKWARDFLSAVKKKVPQTPREVLQKAKNTLKGLQKL